MARRPDEDDGEEEEEEEIIGQVCPDTEPRVPWEPDDDGKGELYIPMDMRMRIFNIDETHQVMSNERDAGGHP